MNKHFQHVWSEAASAAVRRALEEGGSGATPTIVCDGRVPSSEL